MKRETRRLIFILFVLIFIFLSPLVILYAWGFKFDFENKVLLDAGAIYLKSIPAGAQIYINEKPAGKTPSFIQKLSPKIYEITVTKENYYPWKKNLIVESGLVTKANSILLINQNPKISNIANISENYLKFFKQPYDLDRLTATVRKKTNAKILKLENIQPDKNSKKIYFLSNNKLYYIDWDELSPEKSTLSNALVSNVLNYALYKNGLMYLSGNNGKIYELDLTSLVSAEFFEDAYPSFTDCKWVFSGDYKKLLCQKQKSIEVLYLDKSNNGCDFKKGDIDRMDFEQKIIEALFYPKTNEHIIVATEDSILITELDNREPRSSLKLINFQNPQIKYDENRNALYFSNGNLLYAIEI